MIKFAFELLDRMSGPAVKIAMQLGKVDKALAANAASTAALEGKTDKASVKTLKSLERQAAALNKQKEKLLTGQAAVASKTAAEAQLASKTNNATSSMTKQESAMKRIGAAASLTATALMAAGAAALGLGAAGSQMLLDAQRYKDTTSAALTFALGTGKAAGETMQEVQRIANLLGVSVGDSMGRFRELQSSGFDTRESSILLQMVADLKAVSGGRDVAIGALAEPLQALKRNEVLTVASFKGLEAAGMSQNRVYAELAKNLGVAIADPTDTNKVKRDVDRALAQRMLRGQKAMDFWAKVNISALGEGKLGEKAKEFQDTTVTGALDKVKSRWESLVQSINSGPLGERLVAVLNRISDALNPDGAGKGIVEVLNRMVGLASRAYDAMKPLMDAFTSGFGEGFSSALSDVLEMVDLLGTGGGTSKTFADGLRAIGSALGAVVVGVGVLVGGLAWLGSTIVEALVTLPANLKDIGRMAIAGLAEGFEAMKGKLESAVTGIKDSVVGKLRSLLSIQSPSRVMMELGGYTAEGFAVGIERGSGDVASAARMGMATPAMRASVTGAGAGRGNVSIAEGAVQINVSGGDIDAERLALLVEERLRALLTGSAIEAGAV